MVSLRPGVLLDVDGTLVDTNYLHTVAWSRAFDELGLEVTMNAIHRLIGMGGDQLVTRLIGHEVPGASDRWHHHYRELHDEVRLLPGARDLVVHLAAAGLAVVLATSSPREELEFFLGLLDAPDAIAASTCADDIERSKPAPDVVHVALDAGNVDPQASVFVGDSTWDVSAARDAGIGVIGVETGGFSRHELDEAGAIAVYRDVAELDTQLRTSPIATLLT